MQNNWSTTEEVSWYQGQHDYVCTGHIDQPANMYTHSMDNGDGASLELVDKFCYLDDMLSVDGDDAAVNAQAWQGWSKFRELVPPLTNKYISLLTRWKLQRIVCRLQSCMLYGSETLPAKKNRTSWHLSGLR